MPVRVLQIGDSHTANDAFSGHMRALLQARFGAAGRGWLPAGIPFEYYRPRLVTVAESGWRHLGAADAPAQTIGIDASVAQNVRGGAHMTLVADAAAGFDRLALEFLAQPHGGAFAVAVDRRPPVRVATAAPEIRVERTDIEVAGSAHEVELVAAEGRVQLIGWAAERRGAGIIWENHGTIGATAGLLGRMSPATVALELAGSRPALIVVAFGTNEGFDDALDPDGYRARFREHVAGLQRAAPQAAILILGPPDGNQRDRSCRREDGREGKGAGDCAGTGDGCRWHEPRNLAAVREAQKAVAAEMGWAFWDWSQAMGGACSMHRLVVGDPPLAYPDHVHLNKAGYAATADVLYFDLINAYERWQQNHAEG